MSEREPLIRNISDTARWVAVYRAAESERRDAHFRDPFAKRLAGDRGQEIARGMPFAQKASWSFVARTVVVDRMIASVVKQGADTVINLAAGLDARPYRMELPSSLRWVEVDLPGILDYKEEILRDEKPVCKLERVRLDLSNVAARRELFARLGSAAKKALVVCEGLIIYLEREEVIALAQDLHAQSSFHHWIVDVSSPGLLKVMQKKMGSQLDQAGAPLKFAPEEGPAFYSLHGWNPIEVREMLHTAADLHRLPFFFRLFALFPEPKQPAGKRPWGGVCLLERQ